MTPQAVKPEDHQDRSNRDLQRIERYDEPCEPRRKHDGSYGHRVPERKGRQRT